MRPKVIVYSLISVLLFAAISWAGPTTTEVARLYVATFNRAPLQAGLDYWANDSGLAIEQIAQSFFDQPEAKALYPEGTSETDFVNAIFQNLFNRDPAPEGLEYWTGPDGLGGSITRDVFILAAINGAFGTDAEILSNKTEVGIYYALSGASANDYSLADITDDYSTITAAKADIDGSSSGSSCGAYVAPGVWQEFDCYNLAAIGKTTSDNPFTPSWRLIGGYWQWGRKGPDASQWYNTNTSNFAHGPTGSGVSDANDGAISGWEEFTYAPDDSWSDDSKTANDPCPAGYRVPTKNQWDGVIANNTQSIVGTWSTTWDDHSNYSAARFFGDNLMLPTAGYRSNFGGALSNRNYMGYYWSSSQSTSYASWYQGFNIVNIPPTGSSGRNYGRPVRCVAE